MGTQQLLLIVLGVIIVGIAVVVGINIFGTNADQANKDAITQDCLRLSAAAQGFYRKPTLLGGGGNAFTGITTDALGMPHTSSTTTTENINGEYVLTVESADSLTIEGTSSTDASRTVTVGVGAGTMGNPVFAGW